MRDSEVCMNNNKNGGVMKNDRSGSVENAEKRMFDDVLQIPRIERGSKNSDGGT